MGIERNGPKKHKHTTADLECGDGEKYCPLDGPQEGYMWEDDGLTVEELELPATTTASVPVVLVTATGNTIS